MIRQKAVTLARAKEIVGTGHLWIYAGFIHAVRGQPVTGDLVDVVMPNGRFYARGLYNPDLKNSCSILTFHDEPITPAFWRSGLPRRCGYGRGSRPRRLPIV